MKRILFTLAALTFAAASANAQATGESFYRLIDIGAMTSNNKQATMPSLPMGKRLTITHIAGSCVGSSDATTMAAYLIFSHAAPTNGQGMMEMKMTKMPYSTYWRHMFSEKVHIELEAGRWAGFRLFRSDANAVSNCFATVYGVLTNAQ